MKALIFGYGKMGHAITHGMQKLGYQVIVADKNLKEGEVDVPNHGVDCSDTIRLRSVIDYEKPNVVISSLPYYLNPNIAEQCAWFEIPYCDLGGNIAISETINKLGNDWEFDVFTDLGLAPGWINIEAEHLYRKAVADDIKVSDVHMYTGGLPLDHRNINPLKYELTWSFDGMWNEYMDNCEILHDFNILKMPGMSCLRPYGTNGYKDANYESFLTSGGSAHTIRDMKNRGVRNCTYNTIRYKGHKQLFKWLSNYLSKDQIDKMVPETKRDFVLMEVRVGGLIKDSYHIDYTWKNSIYHQDFTAMQRATAFALCSVANQMSKNKKNKPWTYKDVVYSKFQNDLRILGLSTGSYNV